MAQMKVGSFFHSRALHPLSLGQAGMPLHAAVALSLRHMRLKPSTHSLPMQRPCEVSIVARTSMTPVFVFLSGPAVVQRRNRSNPRTDIMSRRDHTSSAVRRYVDLPSLSVLILDGPQVHALSLSHQAPERSCSVRTYFRFH